MSDKETLYRTSDIYFSSYLCALDIPLTTTERDTRNRSKVIFVFKLAESNLTRLKAQYFGGQGTVKARQFADSLRSLKSMCHT